MSSSLQALPTPNPLPSSLPPVVPKSAINDTSYTIVIPPLTLTRRTEGDGSCFLHASSESQSNHILFGHGRHFGSKSDYLSNHRSEAADVARKRGGGRNSIYLDERYDDFLDGKTYGKGRKGFTLESVTKKWEQPGSYLPLSFVVATASRWRQPFVVLQALEAQDHYELQAHIIRPDPHHLDSLSAANFTNPDRPIVMLYERGHFASSPLDPLVGIVGALVHRRSFLLPSSLFTPLSTTNPCTMDDVITSIELVGCNRVEIIDVRETEAELLARVHLTELDHYDDLVEGEQGRGKGKIDIYQLMLDEEKAQGIYYPGSRGSKAGYEHGGGGSIDDSGVGRESIKTKLLRGLGIPEEELDMATQRRLLESFKRPIPIRPASRSVSSNHPLSGPSFAKCIPHPSKTTSKQLATTRQQSANPRLQPQSKSRIDLNRAESTGPVGVYVSLEEDEELMEVDEESHGSKDAGAVVVKGDARYERHGYQKLDIRRCGQLLRPVSNELKLLKILNHASAKMSSSLVRDCTRIVQRHIESVVDSMSRRQDQETERNCLVEFLRIVIGCSLTREEFMSSYLETIRSRR